MTLGQPWHILMGSPNLTNVPSPHCTFGKEKSEQRTEVKYFNFNHTQKHTHMILSLKKEQNLKPRFRRQLGTRRILMKPPLFWSYKEFYKEQSRLHWRNKIPPFLFSCTAIRCCLLKRGVRQNVALQLGFREKGEKSVITDTKMTAPNLRVVPLCL